MELFQEALVVMAIGASALFAVIKVVAACSAKIEKGKCTAGSKTSGGTCTGCNSTGRHCIEAGLSVKVARDSGL